MKRIMKTTAAAMMSVMLLCANAYAADADNVQNIAIGAGRNEIRTLIGDPYEVSVNGMKEIYHLDDSTIAVLLYGGDSLQYGYILE